MSTVDEKLRTIRDAVQVDVANRGLARDRADNLLTACRKDFAEACRSIADHPSPRVSIVTGFMIPSVEPPTGETDGPLGALFLARAFASLGVRSRLTSDGSGLAALASGLAYLKLDGQIELTNLADNESLTDPEEYRSHFQQQVGKFTHLIALERVGPSHRVSSIREQRGSKPEDVGRFVKAVPRPKRGRCYTMRGRDITDLTAPAHRLFEGTRDYVTIGIGDGGNEIGMGKVPYATICKNIPNGELVACRTATDHLIVAGVSNWGAYALAAGVMLLKGRADASLFDPAAELKLLEHLVQNGPLVDGVTGQRMATVDGLSFDVYAKPLERIREVLRTSGFPA